MNTALIMLIAYMIVTLAISAFFARKKRDASEYMVAKRSLGAALIVPLLFSEMIAGAGTIGNAAAAFKGGLSSVWLNWGMTVGCIMLIIFAAKFYRVMSSEKNVMSIPEAFKNIFDNRSRMVLLVIVVIVYGILYSSQPVAAASIISPMIGVNVTVIALVISAIFIVVTLFGGMEGIAWMNVVHTVVMFIGMFIVMFKSVGSVGGIAQMQAMLPKTYFSFFQPSVSTTVANAIGTGVSFLAAATVASVTFSAKSLKSAKWGIIIAAVLVIPFALTPALIGMSAKIALPGVNPNAALFAMAESLGSVFAGMVSMAIIAAIWSTGPALLLVISTTLTKDFYRTIKPESTDVQQLRFSKFAVVAIGVVFTIFGLNAGSILNQMLGAFQIRSVVGIVLVFALFWPRVTKDAAFWSMLCGGIVAGVWHFTGSPFGIAPLWPSALVCLIILIPMTLMSKEKVSPGYRMYKEALESAKAKGEL